MVLPLFVQVPSFKERALFARLGTPRTLSMIQESALLDERHSGRFQNWELANANPFSDRGAAKS